MFKKSKYDTEYEIYDIQHALTSLTADRSKHIQLKLIEIQNNRILYQRYWRCIATHGGPGTLLVLCKIAT